MRYVRAKYAEYNEALAYRIYVSDSLYYLNTDKKLVKRYIDIIKPYPQDKRTGDEIAIDVITKLGLKVE